jgi:hypothetical protein
MLRSSKERNPVLPPDHLRTRLRLEPLEDRLTPSWGGVPPSVVPVPTAFTPVTLNANGDASGSAVITANETDWYRFAATAGTFTFRASTPTSNVDTVIGIYNAAGQRVAYNDDIAWYNRDSLRTVTLSGGTYYLGVTNYIGTIGGGYVWSIDGPTLGVPPPPPPPPPPPTGGFSITLQMTGLTASQQTIFRQAANRWAQIITGDLPNATFSGIAVDDVLIAASSIGIDGPGGILGQAGPDRFRSGTLLPYHGIMQFDTADLAALQANGGLYYTVLHEIGHILGIGTIWQSRGLLSGAGTTNPRFTGARATAAYNAIFGTNATGVPVENGGGAGTRDSHWEESILGNELMTGFLNGGVNPLSRITAASLADLGYQVNLNAADAYIPGGGSLLGVGGGGGGGGGNLMSGSGCGCGVCSSLLGGASAGSALPVPNCSSVATTATGTHDTTTDDSDDQSPRDTAWLDWLAQPAGVPMETGRAVPISPTSASNPVAPTDWLLDELFDLT